MGHDHVHVHDVQHFECCTDPATCFCEVQRYVLATFAGFFFASFQWWLATRMAGSYGAEGDALHMFADSLFVLVSTFLALWKHYDKKHTQEVERLGIVCNSAFLFVAASMLLYRLYFGDAFHHFSGVWMFAAGMLGLVGNLAQLVVLQGESKDGGITMLSTTRQHVVYDILYSVAVVAGAAVSWIGWGREIDAVVAHALAAGMLLSVASNIRHLYGH